MDKEETYKAEKGINQQEKEDKNQDKSDDDIDKDQKKEKKKHEGKHKETTPDKIQEDTKKNGKKKAQKRDDKRKKTKKIGSAGKLKSSPHFNEGPENKDDSIDYHEDQIPPNFELCERHMLARISAPERNDDALNDKNNHCKCCGYIIEREPLPLNCKYQSLGFLGVGIPLFFSYIQSCFIVLLIIFCISGAYNMGSNNYAGDCLTQDQIDLLVNQTKLTDPSLVDSIQDKTCLLGWVSRISLGNKINHDDHLNVQRWLNVATVAVLMIYFQIMRKNQRKIHKDCDESQVTPADYTVIVYNIKTGLGIDYDDELKTFFEENAIPGKKSNIVSVNLGYDMNQKISIDRKKDATVDKKQKALAYKNEHGKYPVFYNEKSTEAQILNYEKQIENIEKEFLSGKTDKFCGIAFVTFLTEDEKEQCLKAHQKTFQERVYLFFMDYMKKAIKKYGKNDLFFYDQRLFIFQAPEPSDVYWENLHYSTIDSLKRKTISNSLSLLMLGGFGIGIYYLSLYQTNINNATTKNNTTSSSDEIKAKVIGTLISICISVVIEFLKIMIPVGSSFEKKKTRTEYFTSVAVKLSIASFCTSSLITFIITATVFDNYFGGSGLINNQIIVFITNLIIPFLVQLINIPYLLKSYQKNAEKKKGKKSTMTQQEANLLFQNPEFVIEKCYAQVAFTMIFTGFYAAVLPLGILFAMATMVLLYRVYKYNLLRKSSVLYDIDSSLAYQMTDLLELTALAFAASEFAFTKLIFDEFPTPSIVCLALAAANFVLPTQSFNEKIFQFKVQNETKTYYEAEDDFDTDYVRENPATGELAREEYEKKEDEEQKLHKLAAENSERRNN